LEKRLFGGASQRRGNFEGGSEYEIARYARLGTRAGLISVSIWDWRLGDEEPSQLLCALCWSANLHVDRCIRPVDFGFLASFHLFLSEF
jgi:hypothetical protein